MTLNDAVTQLGNSIINLINKKTANADVKATLIPNNTDLSTLTTPDKIYYGTANNTYPAYAIPSDVLGKGFCLYVLNAGCTDSVYKVMQVMYTEDNTVYTQICSNKAGVPGNTGWRQIAKITDIRGIYLDSEVDLNTIYPSAGAQLYYTYSNTCINVPTNEASNGFALQVYETKRDSYVQVCILQNGDMYCRTGEVHLGGTSTWTTWAKIGSDGGSGGQATSLSIGEVTTGNEASASITGEAPNQVLNLVLPKGDKGDTGVSGIPTGGTAGQLLCKVDGTDYNTEWTGTSIVIENWED